MIALAEALAWLATRSQRREPETVALAEASGRVLAEDVPGSLEHGRVAAIDGHAVRAAATEGASEYAPLPAGGVPLVAGAAMPEGTDAVLPLALIEAGSLALAAVAPGHGVAEWGESGLAAGTVLRPAHLAVLARLGRRTVEAVRRPRVAVRVSGAKQGPDALTTMLGGAGCGGGRRRGRAARPGPPCRAQRARAGR